VNDLYQTSFPLGVGTRSAKRLEPTAHRSQQFSARCRLALTAIAADVLFGGRSVLWIDVDHNGARLVRRTLLCRAGRRLGAGGLGGSPRPREYVAIPIVEHPILGNVEFSQ
jgi:hypothetical protein